MDPTTGAPVCMVCNHAHVDGERCPMCGHTGRADGLKLTRSRGPTNPALHFIAADSSSLPPPKFKEHLLLASILRKLVFVEELGGAEPAFELTDNDYLWRHVFAQRGDAPIGYVRWRVHANPSTFKPVFGVLDMLAVSQRSRRQEIAKRLIGYCIRDIAVRLADPSEFVGVFAVVPQEPVHVPHTFVRMGFRFVPPETPLPDSAPRPAPGKPEVLVVCPPDIMLKIMESMLDPSYMEPHEQAHRLPQIVQTPAPAPTPSTAYMPPIAAPSPAMFS